MKACKILQILSFVHILRRDYTSDNHRSHATSRFI